MTDSDPKDLGFDLDALDWDTALEEWEKNTFVPEVARDQETQQVAAPLESPEGGSPTTAPMGGRLADQARGEPDGPSRAIAPESLEQVSGSGTVIAPVLEELRDHDPELVRRTPSGGLSQLFAKDRPRSKRPPSPSASTRAAPFSASDVPPPPDLNPETKQPTSVTKQYVAQASDDLFEDAAESSDNELTVVGRSPTGVDPEEVPNEAPTLERAIAADDEQPTQVFDQAEVDRVAREAEEKAAADGEPAVRAKADSLSDAETATRIPDEPRAAPSARSSAPAARESHEPPRTLLEPPETERKRAPVPEGPSVFPEERPVSRWLDEAQAKSFHLRARWLDEEARALDDTDERARALLVVSELHALVGAHGDAWDAAIEARDLAGDHTLPWRQSRQLMEEDPTALAEALDAEAARSPTPAARVHSTLMAAEVLRSQDLGNAAVDRWTTALKLDPSDPRAALALAALSLSQDDHTGATHKLADNSDLYPLASAVATALRLRGVGRGAEDGTPSILNDGLREARSAFEAGDGVAVAKAMSEMGKSGGLKDACAWVAAAVGSQNIAGRRMAARHLKSLAADGDSHAIRALAARGLELGDPELLEPALGGDSPLSASDRAALRALMGIAEDPEDRDQLAAEPALRGLTDALYACSPPQADLEWDAERDRVAGLPDTRTAYALGRMLAKVPSTEDLRTVLSQLPSEPATLAGAHLELAIRQRSSLDLSDLVAHRDLTGFEIPDHERLTVAALLAEFGGHHEAAAQTLREAAESAPLADSLIRWISELDPDTDLGERLYKVADEAGDTAFGALLRAEALVRHPLTEAGDLDEAYRRIHESAPELGLGSFLAERQGRRRGDVDEVLHWIRQRRVHATDPLELGLDAVREALLVADSDADVATQRLLEAHASRPDDVALRELLDRLAQSTTADRAEFREVRGQKAEGASRALWLTEAAWDYESIGDWEGALRTAQSALETQPLGIARLVCERAEVALGKAARTTERLMDEAKGAGEDHAKLEAYSRLAEIDEGSSDAGAALLWHKSMLELDAGRLSSLRYVEHTLITERRDDELLPYFVKIAHVLDGDEGGEVSAHACHAVRLHVREGLPWKETRDLAGLATRQPTPPLWGLRAQNAHARARGDHESILKTTVSLLDRTLRPAERASLLLRAAGAATALDRASDAEALLEQASSEDPGDVITWGLLAEVRGEMGDARGAAEACESLARTSTAAQHQLLAWYDAARMWLEEVEDAERGMSALEQVAEIDVGYADVFVRLSGLYAEKSLDAELARLLERRLESLEDPEERVALEVDLARALGEMGELARARGVLSSALELRPDHTTALSALAELAAREGDWQGAEQSYVRLARLAPTDEEQCIIYDRLGDIYATELLNLSRAEVAYREILKRSPKDEKTLKKLVALYRRQGDVSKAATAQRELVDETDGQDARLESLMELADIYESTGRDLRRSEQVLESARREYPTSVVALRALAEFYKRHGQGPAVQILLDRAASDARRSFSQGRFVSSLFEILHAAYELRGRSEGARVVAATLAAVEGEPAELKGAGPRGLDPQIDDLLAPELIGSSLRQLFQQVGDAVDHATAIDPRALSATPLQPGTPLGSTIGGLATVVGLGALQVLVSPKVGKVAIPFSSSPPTLVVGEQLLDMASHPGTEFIVARALKAILTRTSALVRATKDDVALSLAALVSLYHPGWKPPAVDPKRMEQRAQAIYAALPRDMDPTVGVFALEAAGAIGDRLLYVGPLAASWMDRVGLTVMGDPSSALDGIGWMRDNRSAPEAAEPRAAWIARVAEARELLTFSVTDAYAEARKTLGL